MGNCLSICRSRKKDNPQTTNITIQSDILSNQLGPYEKHNDSGVNLNSDTNQNSILQKGNKEQLIQINDDLKNKFKAIMKTNAIYYQDMEKQNEYISNYKSFLNDLNHELNNYHEQLNISIRGQKLGEALSNKKDKVQLLKN